MFIVFEISRPFQRKINWYRCPGVTTFGITWLWFSLSLHPMRFDEMTTGIANGTLEWDKRRWKEWEHKVYNKYQREGSK